MNTLGQVVHVNISASQPLSSPLDFATICFLCESDVAQRTSRYTSVAEVVADWGAESNAVDFAESVYSQKFHPFYVVIGAKRTTETWAHALSIVLGDIEDDALIATPSPAFRMLAPDAATSSFTIAVEMLSGDATIDWGDGSEPTVTSGGAYTDGTGVSNTISHDYSGFVGAAIISVTGDIKRVQASGSGVTEVLDFGIGIQHYLFAQLVDLIIVPPILPSSVTTMDYMFLFTQAFDNAVVSGWDVSNVTSMKYAFYFSVFNQPLNSWNTSNVESLYGTFRQCLYNQPLDNWNIDKVVTIKEFMYGSNVFNQPVPSQQNGVLTDTSKAFSLTAIFNQPVSIDMVNVTDADQMFNNATAFDQDLSGWCVTNLLTEPTNFSTGSALTEPHKPIWGTCPSP